MKYTSLEAATLFELRFWLQILGDHARFIHGSLTADEREELTRAEMFIQSFDSMLESVRAESTVYSIYELNKAAFQKGQELRFFKLHLLKRHLSGKIKINLPPTFLNHMVNEVEEALSIFQSLQAGQIPPLQDPLHHHLVWLQDAFGHAASVSCRLDLVEKRLKEKSNKFTKHFEEFYLKAVELAGYTRTGLRNFPALNWFNKEVELEMLLFMEFLKELEEMGLTREILGTLMPLMADHMAREECYYLTKLSWVSEVNHLNCDPTKPRVES
ncbi:protein of unknown function [Paenibacillus sp. yr247]|uniref:DUF2935 domain-containing protein n=1 Tax=Paenibacillus sp. yr247 TaxID=1761880 RepID=UPI0008887FD7|nr:DUF2935 domain-containing protein [Paenibacillus sp. yr247]SDN71417.1 protein of unknown function [Paenibacillus sp. yr247]